MTTQINAQQSDLWLRGLLTIAWSDGNFDDREKQLIATLVEHPLEDIKPTVTAEELRSNFEPNSAIAENFLRSAVMVALADGVYSSTEDEILQTFCDALGTSHEILDTLRLTLCNLDTQTISPLVQPTEEPDDLTQDQTQDQTQDTTYQNPSLQPPYPSSKLDPLRPVREWLDGMDIQDPKVARFLCKLIPSQCPFERDVVVFKKKLVHIPPMCKINPLYEQLVGLRFRSLSYLADVCKEDITPYI
jgi:tellurite resistance protein